MSDHAPASHPHARSAGAFGILAGIAMLLLWAWLIATGNVDSLEPRPLGTWLHMHIAGEVLTAVILIVAGWGLLTTALWAGRLFLLANGMLLLAVIHAIAWYGERGEVGMVVAVFAVGVLAVFFAIRSQE
jgi:hypothetical protein